MTKQSGYATKQTGYFWTKQLGLNTTGLSFYVNVRSQNGATIVGYAEERTGEGAFFVNYRPGYGILNEYYRPSAQTDNDATKPVYIEGKWRP